MRVNTHLYSHKSHSPMNIFAGWTLWFVGEECSPWHNVECKFFPAKPTKKQVRKLRRKFIKDCKSC